MEAGWYTGGVRGPGRGDTGRDGTATTAETYSRVLKVVISHACLRVIKANIGLFMSHLGKQLFMSFRLIWIYGYESTWLLITHKQHD